MRRAILPISLVLLSFGALTALFMWIFQGQRDDVAAAREFLTLLAAGDHGAASEFMTPALSRQINSADLNLRLGNLEQWDRLSFPSRSSNWAGEDRSTEITGTGTTVSGCESSLTIRIENGQIDAFNITPLCPAQDVET